MAEFKSINPRQFFVPQARVTTDPKQRFLAEKEINQRSKDRRGSGGSK